MRLKALTEIYTMHSFAQLCMDSFGRCRVRSEVNIELNFPPKLRGARSRLYRRRFLQVNTRWKALAEIYTMHSFAPFSNLNFFVKNRQKLFATEVMNFINSIANNSNFAFFLRIFDEFFFRISRQIPENSDVCRFFNQICENRSELCRTF